MMYSAPFGTYIHRLQGGFAPVDPQPPRVAMSARPTKMRLARWAPHTHVRRQLTVLAEPDRVRIVDG